MPLDADRLQALEDLARRLVEVIEGADALAQKGFSAKDRIRQASLWARSELVAALTPPPAEGPQAMPEIERGDYIHDKEGEMRPVRSQNGADDWNTVLNDRVQAVYRPIWRRPAAGERRA